MERKKKIFILAGEYRQAERYAKENKLNPNDWSPILDERDLGKLMGWINPKVVRVGTYFKLKDISRIERFIASTMRPETAS